MGKLCVHVRIKTTTQQLTEVPSLKKIALAPTELVIGLGACLRERRVHKSPSSEDVGAMVGDQNIVALGRAKRSALKEINIPTDANEMEQSPPEKVMGLGAQQLEVISELIERGQLLRSKMVESIISQRTERVDLPDGKEEM